MKEFNSISNVIVNSNKIISESEDLKSLNEFVLNQRLQYKGLQSTETIFNIWVAELQVNNQKVTIQINKKSTIVSFYKLNTPDLYQIKINQVTCPKVWKHDLRFTIYFQKEDDFFTQLGDKSGMILKNCKSTVLCNFNISKLINENLKSEDFISKEEIKQPSKANIEKISIVSV